MRVFPFFSLLSWLTTVSAFMIAPNRWPVKSQSSVLQFYPPPSHSNHNMLFSSATEGSEGTEEAEDAEEPEFLQVESLAASQVIELIELSFFQACYALSKGDIEPLKLFIVAVKTASKKYPGASAIAITKTVDSAVSTVRPLEPAERELRETWIRAVFLMMGHVLDDFDAATNDEDKVFKTYSPALEDLVDIHQSGLGLNINRFVATRKDFLMPPRASEKKNILELDDGPEEEDFMQLSIVTQTIRVLYTTLEVLTDDSAPEASETDSRESTSKDKKKGKKKDNKASGGKGFA